MRLPFDLYRHDVFMTMQPVGEDTIREIIDDVWLPLLRAPGVRSEGPADPATAAANSRDADG